MPLLRFLILALFLPGLLVACSNEPETPAEPTPTETPSPTPIPTWTLVPATPTQTPLPTATPLPELSTGQAIIVGGDVRTRAEPSTQAEVVRELEDLSVITVVDRVQGEDWLKGQQDWFAGTPPWSKEWFQLDDGSYVYGPFVFILGEGERSPLAPVPGGVEKWIDVSISQQTARAMVGDEAVFTARVSTGEARFPTPQGSLAIEPDGRLAVVRMTASQAGYDASQADYDVERVLFTQYFDQQGNALHLNYWRPSEVFGNVPTSHGCVGMELHEAQYFWLFGEPGMRVEIHE